MIPIGYHDKNPISISAKSKCRDNINRCCLRTEMLYIECGTLIRTSYGLSTAGLLQLKPNCAGHVEEMKPLQA